MLDKTIAHFRILEKLGGWNAPIMLGGRMLGMYTGNSGHPLYFDHPNALGSEMQWTDAAVGTGREIMQMVKAVVVALARYGWILNPSVAHMPESGMYAPPAETENVQWSFQTY